MLTLEEGAAWLDNHVDGCRGATARQLLRAGIAGALLVCVPLDTRAYSPTLRAEQDKGKGAPGSESHDAYLQRLLVEAPAYEMLGLFVVPPRFLLTLETEESVSLEGAFSLDGKHAYFPHVRIRRDQLRVVEQHLRDFAGRIEITPDRAPGGPLVRVDSGAHDPAATGRIHRLKSSSDAIDTVINEAIKGASDPSDREAIWAQIVAWASESSPRLPLLGIRSGAVRYQVVGGEESLSRRNFGDRMRRRAKPR